MENDVSLKEYTEKLIAHERELREQMINENKIAMQIANRNMEIRLEGMNELRAQINQERGKYITREMSDQANNSIDKRLKIIEVFSANIQGRMWMFASIMAVIGTVIPIVISILTWFIHK